MTDIAAKLQEEKLLRALRARIRFKSIVRHVIHNKPWLLDDEYEEQDTDDFDNVDTIKKAVARVARKPRKKGALSVVEKAILRKPLESRTEKERDSINKVIGGLKCFRRYPEDVQFKLVSVTYFFYFGPGRVLVKQDHEAHSMYFLLSGEVVITRRVFDQIINEWVSLELGTMSAGGMFGEVSLLHDVQRTATVRTITPCELLVLMKEDFNNVLKATIKARWDDIRDAMMKFSYFDDWGDVAIRECCILSKIKSFEPNTIILGDGVDQGSQDLVYFVIEGACVMIEHLFIKETVRGGRTYYQQYKFPIPENKHSLENQTRISYSIISDATSNTGSLCKSSQEFHSAHSLQDPIGKWQRGKHEKSILINVPLLKTSITQNKLHLPSNVKLRFMQVCIFEEKSTFFDNESLQNRRVIAKTNVKCLLIPSYWLIQHNRGNVWSRVSHFVKWRIPNKNHVFKEYVNNRRWQEYKNKLTADILKKKKFPNNTTIHDVPYSIRVNSELD